MADPVPALIDPVAAWRSLAPEQQQQLGVAAIIHLLGLHGVNVGLEPRAGFQAAEFAGREALIYGAAELLPGAFDPPHRPDLSALGIVTCRVCGCTDHVGCGDGCWWVEPGLCSACAPSRDPAHPLRACDHCGKTYAGPGVYCSRTCAITDA